MFWPLRYLVSLNVKVDRMVNFAEEHGNKIAVMLLDRNIGNLTKVELTLFIK